MLWDTHMHCYFSDDCNTPPVQMVEAAIKRGLTGICFTDHLDKDYPDAPEKWFIDFDQYQKEIYALKDAYKDKLEILWGIELGMQPHLDQFYLDITNKHPFDFVISSSHALDGRDLYQGGYFQEYPEAVAYRRYFEYILENINTELDYDVYGHLDYVVRYGPNKNLHYSYEKYADIIDEVLRTLISRGKGIEINLSGFRYGMRHPHPTEDILSRYRQLGGEIITIGSDSHTPGHIEASCYEKVPELLKNAGFDYYTIFKNRKPEFIKL